MSFRPLPARASATLLREAKPLKALFGEARRLDRLQQLVDSQLQPAAREFCRTCRCLSSGNAGQQEMIDE